jgi:8-oxo-dGTP pyrophosphatase MutT (NUDIX family)
MKAIIILAIVLFSSRQNKMNETKIIPIERLELTLVDWQWPFANDHRAAITSHFKILKQKKPALWNGRVLLLRYFDLSDVVLRGVFFEADFADLLAWRDWGFPDQTIHACFAMAAIEGIDKGFVLGAMGQHTANSGLIYFPTGTPDRDDLDGERVDFDRSVRRELAEETGLEFDEFHAEFGWHAVFSGRHIAMIKRLRALESAENIRGRIRAFLAKQQQPEFSDIHLFYRHTDLTSAVPLYVRAYLEHVWCE